MEFLGGNHTSSERHMTNNRGINLIDIIIAPFAIAMCILMILGAILFAPVIFLFALFA
jgi:hypothetical protein